MVVGTFVMGNLINIRFNPTRELCIIAGPNGVGKTTLWYGLKNPGIEYVNQDEIKKNLETQCGHTVHVNVASKHAASRMLQLFRTGCSFACETTLDAKKPLSILSNPKDYNYNVSICYVAPLSVEDCIKNVRKRVENKGHGVPEDTIRIRYARSISNFYEICPHVHNWYLFLNNENNHEFVAQSANGDIKLVKPELVQHLPQRLQGIFTDICR